MPHQQDIQSLQKCFQAKSKEKIHFKFQIINHKEVSPVKKIDQSIDTHTRQLIPPSVRADYKEIAERSAKTDTSYEIYQLTLLEKESLPLFPPI